MYMVQLPLLLMLGEGLTPPVNAETLPIALLLLPPTGAGVLLVDVVGEAGEDAVGTGSVAGADGGRGRDGDGKADGEGVNSA